jgi:putative membrane protein
MFRLLLQWLLSAVSVMVLVKVLPGFHVNNFGTAIVVAAVYGVLHILFYNLLALVAFIPMFLTFGLFGIVINAFLLFLTDKLMDDFKIDTLAITLVAAVLLTILNMIWRWLLF